MFTEFPNSKASCGRIVICDAQPLFRRGVRAAISEVGGFAVDAECGDGATALQLVNSMKPDMLVLDICLPDTSGLEVLRSLMASGSETKCVFLTGSIDRPQTIAALRLGVRGVILKDVSAPLLVRALHAVSRGEYWIGREMMVDWVKYTEHQKTPRMTLTQRERQIIDLVVAGYSNVEAAQKLGVSDETVKTHVSNIYKKLGVSSRVELAGYVGSGKLRQLA